MPLPPLTIRLLGPADLPACKALLAAFDQLVRQLPGLEQVGLSVTASNARAAALYEHAGFVRYGLLPRAIKIDGRYHDKALMVKVP